MFTGYLKAMEKTKNKTILVINIHAALDRIFFIDRFVPDAHMRAKKTLECIGGKGLDTAVVLKELGAVLRAVTFIAGANGQILARLLAEKGIDTELLWVEGETRVANVIVETENQCHSHITTTGYHVDRKDCDQLLETIQNLGRGAEWAVISGSLPPGAPPTIYQEIVRELHAQGVKVLIDSLGPPLLLTLPLAPEIVKMNRTEFSETFHNQAGNLEEWVGPVRKIMAEHALKSFVLTGGSEGILAVSPEGVYLAECKVKKEVNAAGAGDAVSAALIHRLYLGDSWEQALTWAAATSAAVVQTEGTAECSLLEIIALLPEVRLRTLPDHRL